MPKWIHIKDIKTKLFTRVTITDYGVRFEHHNKEMQKKERMHPSLFIIIVHLLHDGSINLCFQYNNHLSAEQLDEIHRVSKLLRGENVEKEN